MNKPRILILGKLPPPYYGPAIATEIILKSDLKNEYELFHINTKLNDSIGKIGKFELLKFYKSVTIYFNFIRIVLVSKPDVVLIPISQSTLGFIKDSFFIILSKILFRKTIIHLRGSNWLNWLNSCFFITKYYIKSILHLCNGVIVLGITLRYLFERDFKPNKIYVVPNGANYQFPEISNNKSVFQLTYIANLHPSKGIEDILCALKLLKDSNIHLSLEVIGAWPNESFKEKCLLFIEKNNLSVNFHGTFSGLEKLKLLKQSDIYVFVPRVPEGHPWSVIEALAAGLPVIATPQGAIVESVFNNINGYIVDVSNPQQIASKIQYLIDNPTRRLKMGEESKRLYEECFTEQKMVENLSKVFQDVISSH